MLLSFSNNMSFTSVCNAKEIVWKQYNLNLKHLYFLVLDLNLEKQNIDKVLIRHGKSGDLDDPGLQKILIKRKIML